LVNHLSVDLTNQISTGWHRSPSVSRESFLSQEPVFGFYFLSFLKALGIETDYLRNTGPGITFVQEETTELPAYYL